MLPEKYVPRVGNNKQQNVRFWYARRMNSSLQTLITYFPSTFRIIMLEWHENINFLVLCHNHLHLLYGYAGSFIYR